MQDDLLSRVDEFVDTQVLPVDDEFDGDVEAAGGDELRVRLQSLARTAGL